MLFKSVVVVTTLIVPASAFKTIVVKTSNAIEILFIILFLINFLILVCTMGTNYKDPAQPNLAVGRFNIIISKFPLQFYFLKFSCKPPGSEGTGLLKNIFIIRLLC